MTTLALKTPHEFPQHVDLFLNVVELQEVQIIHRPPCERERVEACEALVDGTPDGGRDGTASLRGLSHRLVLCFPRHFRRCPKVNRGVVSQLA